MKGLIIKLDKVESVQNFINVATSVDFDIDLVRGRYVIDAKSIIGIYSLDLSKPIECNLHCRTESEYQKFVSALDKAEIDYNTRV